MRRREFINLIGAAAASWPLPARAQQGASVRIGFISSASLDLFKVRVQAFHRGLAEQGYVEGQNVVAEYRWAEGQNEYLKQMAQELVTRRVAVIVASGEPAALAAKAATHSTPIVFVGGSDPVQLGIVGSLKNPGGNVTGITVLNVEMASKRLQVLHEIVPSASRVAALLDRSSPGSAGIAKQLSEAAISLGVGVDVIYANDNREVVEAFGGLAQRQTRALLIGSSARFNAQSEQLGLLSMQNQVPAIYQTREFVTAGGLAAYGGSIVDAYRLAGSYCGRILKGEGAGNLPIHQATRVEMIINMKTAKALGISIPLPLLGRADEVIE